MPEFSLSLSLCTHIEEMSSEDMGKRQLSENHRESSPKTKLPTPFLFFFFFWLCAGASLRCMGFLLWYVGLVAHCMRDLVPKPQIKPMSPALEGGFLTTGPPGKSPDLQHLDLGLPASRTVRNKCCVRPPAHGHGCPRRLTHWMTSTAHIFASVLQSLFFPLYISA